MTDLIELLRNRNEHVAQRAADELERKDAAIAELVAALNAMLTHLGMDEDEWTKPTFNQARAVITKHKQPTTTTKE